MRSIFTLMGTICFWIVSSESLVLAGNSAGRGVSISLTSLLLFTLVVFVSLFVALSTQEAVDGDAPVACKRSVSYLIIPMGLAGIVGSTLFASTGILVTAGFTFNEVFYYRFPNFGFSFLVLGLVLFLQLLPAQIRGISQSLFVFVCLFSIIILTAYGLFLDNGVATGPSMEAARAHSYLISLPLLLVFTGFGQIKHCLHQRRDLLRAAAAFFPAVILLAGWIYVSAQYVSSDRLIFSSIPYMAAASKILGDPGRYIMGTAIIAGCFAAVNGLIEMSRRYTDKTAFLKSYHAGKVSALLLSIVIGVLLGAGVAGMDELEVFIRSSLVLWLLYSGCCGLFESVQLKEISPAVALWGLIASGIIIICSVVLFLSQKDLKTAVLFTTAMLGGSVLISVLVWSIKRLKRQTSIIN